VKKGIIKSSASCCPMRQKLAFSGEKLTYLFAGCSDCRLMTQNRILIPVFSSPNSQYRSQETLRVAKKG